MKILVLPIVEKGSSQTNIESKKVHFFINKYDNNFSRPQKIRKI